MRRDHNSVLETGCEPWTAALHSALHAAMRRAIAQRVFPGAVIGVLHGQHDWVLAAGTTQYDDPGSQPVLPGTIYDIASLTKVITATAALRLADQGRLDLHAAVQTYLPAFHDDTCRIIHLLTHTSGLNLRLSTLAPQGAHALRQAIYATRPSHAPGTVVAYTNINSLLLGDVVAAVYQAPLAQAIHDLVLAPLGMRETFFRPEAGSHARIAPTEYDHQWRRRLIHGTVHDESAHALDGVAGHAGLFSTAGDLLLFGSAWLAAWHGKRQDFLLPTTAQQACRVQTPPALTPCGWGWMLDRAQFMGQAPAGTYGHTGFTGPAIVTIPSQNVIVVVLSNRVYPQRANPVHHAVTAEIVQTVLQYSSASHTR